MLGGVQPSTAPRARPVPRIARITLTPELFYLDEPVLAVPDDPPTHHVRAALDLRLRALLRHDGGTRTGEDIEDLHQMRVAVRRMRAALRSARPVLDRTWADGLRAELGWLGRALGPTRDLDVMLARFRDETADLPTAERAAAGRLIEDLERQRTEARRAMLQALASTRYHALLERLADTVRLPLPGRSATEQQPAMADLIRAEYRKLRRAVHRAGRAPADEVLHDLRIRGKRLRYTAELVEPSMPPPTARAVRALIKTATRFQEVLGDHQDACVAAQRIEELLDGLVEQPDVSVAFVAGRLVERERGRAAAARAGWKDAWRDVSARMAAIQRRA
jgi:CHAD domain-containing protein